MENNHQVKDILKGKTILFIIDEYVIGGVVTYVNVLSKEIISKGGKVIIFGFNYNLEKNNYFNDCTIVVVNRKPHFRMIGRIFDLLVHVKELEKIYKNHQVDTIHFSTTWSAIYTLFHWKSWLIRKVSTFHGSYCLESEFFDFYYVRRKYLSRVVRNHTTFVRRRVKNILQLISLKNSEKIHVLSRYSKKILTENMNKNLSQKIIVESRVVGFYNKKDANLSITSWKKRDKKTFHILNYGRSEERKGLKVLFEACSILQNQYPTFNFLLTVATPCTEEFLQVFEHYENYKLFKKVRFLHRIDFEMKKQLIQESDVFIMPSLDLETYGLTMVECLSLGLPVIGSSSSAIPEILNLVDRRLIYKSPSAKSLAKKIIWLSNLDENEIAQLRQRSIDVAEDLHISKSTIIESLYG